METYGEILNNLETCLNGTKNKANTELFLNSIRSLKNDFGQRISTKFLRNLIKGKSNRQKTNKIYYLLLKSGVGTYRETRQNFKEWVLNCFETDIIEYAINNKGKVFIKDVRNQEVGNLSIQNKNEILTFITA